jgi:hypothetical protein
MPRICANYYKVTETKTLFKRIVPDSAIPDIGYYCNGNFLTADLEVVPAAQAREAFFDGRDRIVFKRDGTLGGSGVEVLTPADFDEARLRSLGNGVFQHFVVQHEALERLSPGPVATLRVITALDDRGEVSVRSAYLRMGRSGQDHLISGRGMICAADLSTGALFPNASRKDWTQLAAHPDTGLKFRDQAVPEFAACMETCRRLHRAIPLVRAIGWDVTVDRDGHVVVLEWGAAFGTSYAEPMHGPLFADFGWERYWREQAA